MKNTTPFTKGPLWAKSVHFARRVLKMSQYLQSVKRTYELNKQVLRSGTAMGVLSHKINHDCKYDGLLADILAVGKSAFNQHREKYGFH